MKKLFSILLASLLILSFASGCGEKPEPPKPIEATEDGGVTYAQPGYYPIVAQPVTLTAAVEHNASYADVLDRTIWAEVTALTGITFDLRPISGAGESAALMFASRDYPDIAFRLDSISALSIEAAGIGDIVELTDELLNSFAPSWAEIFKNDPVLYRLSVYPDGKLYALPNCVMQEDMIYLRDCWMINGEWLEELGMQMPETLDDFTNYLRAVKNAAGTGSIPSNAVPLYSRHMQSNIGGWFTIADTFGLYNGIRSHVVENGVVKSQAQNPLLKDVMKYMNQLYSEGLMNSNFNTSDWTIYTAAVDYNSDQTAPWFVGSHFGYDAGTHDFLSYMPMLKTNTGKAPVVRPTGLSERCFPNAFIIFAKCQYPVAALRLADYFGSTEGSLHMYYGTKGTRWDIAEDGSYYLIPQADAAATLDTGLASRGPAIVSAQTALQLIKEKVLDPKSRVYAYENLYKDLVPKNIEVFPESSMTYLSAEESAEATTIWNQINSAMKSTTSEWIRGIKDVDATWDDFQKKLVDLKIDRLLELQQKAYNLYASASIG